jgi:hypothetical protein
MALSKAEQKAAFKKMSATCANKLIPRLARYLGRDDAYGKQQVRILLREGGYKGPRWKDESRAVKILAEAGKDMSKFERLSSRAPLPGSAGNGNGATHVAITTPGDDAAEKLRKIQFRLKQGETILIRELKDGTRAEIGEVENLLISALNIARS